MAEDTKKSSKKKSKILEVHIEQIHFSPNATVIWFDKDEELEKLVDFNSEGVVMIDKEGTKIIFVGDMIYVRGTKK